MPADLRAHLAVARAVAEGRLPHLSIQTCVTCGVPAQAYHHDQGYARPHWLDVVAVCDRCHSRRHQRSVARGEQLSRVMSVRLSAEECRMIKEAAALNNRPASNFVLAAAVREAEALVRRQRRVARAGEGGQDNG